MAISTKNVNSETTGGGGFVRKNLAPSTQMCKITRIWLEKSRFERDGIPEYDLMLNLEGVEQAAGFEGFFLDKNNPTLGRYKGQTGFVKMNEYTYRDGTTKSGVAVFRDTDLLRDLKVLCVELDKLSWFEAMDGKFETVEALVAAMDAQGVCKDTWMTFCLSGREYINRAGYTEYELFISRPSNLGKSFSKDANTVQKFFESEHIRKYKPKTLANGFGGETKAVPMPTTISTTTPAVKTVVNTTATPYVNPSAGMTPAQKFEYAKSQLVATPSTKVTPAAAVKPATSMTPNTDWVNQSSAFEPEDDFLKSLNEPIGKDIAENNDLEFSLD